MKTIITILITSVFSIISYSQEIPSDSLYLGFTIPGKTPEVFAPGVISLEDRNDLIISFSPDGREIIYGTHLGNFFREYTANRWSEEKDATFSGYGNPTFSTDGNRIYSTKWSADYSSSDFWMVKRTDEGWSEPELMPAVYNSGTKVGNITESSNGDMYFDTDNKIYQTIPIDSLPTEAHDLGSIINSQIAYCPCIAHDGSYLIFCSEQDDMIGNQDLYISFKNQNDEWTEPMNMNSAGANINVEAHSCINPSLSPDGKYLFYNFHDWAGLKPDIYWVSTEIIDDLRDIVLSTSVIDIHHPNIHVFPNPSEGQFNIKNVFNKIVDYKIVGINGTVIKKGTTDSEEINISGIKKGIYFIQFEIGNQVLCEKIIIK